VVAVVAAVAADDVAVAQSNVRKRKGTTDYV